MRNERTFVSREQQKVQISVRPNDDDTFETNLCCPLRDCGKTVEIDSVGPRFIQNLSCPEHGFLASFPHQIALLEFVRSLANKILEMDGHTLIDAEAAFIVGDSQSKWMN